MINYISPKQQKALCNSCLWGTVLNDDRIFCMLHRCCMRKIESDVNSNVYRDTLSGRMVKIERRKKK